MIQDNHRAPLIYLIAGEASGDLIGAGLMMALRDLNPNVCFAGIGGAAMINCGLKSLFPMQELSIMGIFEVIPRIFRIFKRIKQTRAHIKQIQPTVVITIDAPGFNFRVIKNLKKLGIPFIHYVAPSVWAWRPGRAKKVAKLYDCLLTLFEFEPKYFTPHGLEAHFVGHPLVEKDINDIARNQFRKQYDIDEKTPLICILPGSRQREIKTLMPIFVDTMKKIQTKISNLEIVIPTLPHLYDQIKLYTDEAKIKALFIVDEASKYAAMRSVSTALVASGTVTLELALAQTPMVVAYKINKLTHIILKLLIKIKYAALPNILLDDYISVECLQENCNSEILTKEIMKLFENNALRATQIKKLAEIRPLIQLGNQTPSIRAAKIVMQYCR